MKITKRQLKQIIKEEIDKATRKPSTAIPGAYADMSMSDVSEMWASVPKEERIYKKSVKRVVRATEDEYRAALGGGHRDVTRTPSGYEKIQQTTEPATEKDYTVALGAGRRDVWRDNKAEADAGLYDKYYHNIST